MLKMKRTADHVRVSLFIGLLCLLMSHLSISSPHRGLMFNEDGSISWYAWYDNDNSFNVTQQPPPTSCISRDCVAIHTFLQKRQQLEDSIREKADLERKNKETALKIKKEVEKREKKEREEAELKSAYEDGYNYGYTFLGKSFTNEGRVRYCLSEALSRKSVAKKNSRSIYILDDDFKSHIDSLSENFRLGCQYGANKSAIENKNFE